MSWYKVAQQGTFFYPYSKSPGYNTEKVRPIGIDPETKENIYQCSICKNSILESEIREWDVPEESGQVSYTLPTYNKNMISQSLKEISQYLLPFYNQLQQYLKETNIEVGYSTEQDALRRWEVQVPQLSNILNKHQELKEICFNIESYDRKGEHNPVCNLFHINGEVNGQTLNSLSDFILSPLNEVENFMQYSNQQYEINISSPICDECLEEMTKCEFCDKHIKPTENKYTTTWDDNSFICESCVENGNADSCSECGKADSTEDMQYMEGEGSLCDDCYKKGNDVIHTWIKEKISNLDIPVGQNLPLSEKNVNSLFSFLKKYIDKYGSKYLDNKEWGRLSYLAQKSGLPQGSLEYLNSIGETYSPSHNSFSHSETKDIFDDVSNNLKAHTYMKEQYPGLSSYQDIPFDIEVESNYMGDKQGFTLTITPSDDFFNYAKKKYPNIKKIWEIMSDTPHHDGTLAYARCAYEQGGEYLVVNNLQRDADFDNYVSRARRTYPSELEAAKWLDNMTKNWNVFLLHIIKAISISENISSYLTTFDQQKHKWGNLPIHKSKKTYQEVPEQMGFELSDPDDAEHLLENNSMYGENMYQIANMGINWYKAAYSLRN